MNESTANAVANEAKPCPFCGEKLTSHNDHHGWWVAHEREPGPCFLSTIQIMDRTDLEGWNRRADTDVAGWALATLTALNVGDVRSGSLLHLKLREVMKASRGE